MSLRLANDLASDLSTEDLERHMAFVAAALRARRGERLPELDELEARKTDPVPGLDEPFCDEEHRESER